MLDAIVKGPLKVVTGTDDGNMKVNEARGACFTFAVLSAFLSSKLTRKRVEENKEPIIGFF